MMRKTTLLIISLMTFLSILASQVQARTMHAEWSAQDISALAGYRLYHENNLACETSDPDATSIDCEVDIDDGETWFTLTYYLSDGTESAHSAPFTCVLSSVLHATISADKEEGPAPLQIVFDAAESNGNISTYEWMFGDGETATGAQVNHTFASQGSYLVTLTTTDISGAVDQETITVVVTDAAPVNQAPVAAISSSSSIGNAPFLVTLDGSISSDSDGTIVSYQWDLGDGGTATGAQITHTYTLAGTYNPTLTVTDNGGLTNSTTTPVLVNPPIPGNTPPTAVISTSTTQGVAPLHINFSGNNSLDTDGSVVAYNWDFGDGTTGSGSTVSHSFSQPADYTVTLTVIDNSGAASQPVSTVVTAMDPNGQEPPKKINLLPIINLLLLED